MPAKRNAFPRNSDQEKLKRSRSLSDSSELTPKPKFSKTENEAQNISVPRDGEEVEAIVESVRRGRGRPRKGASPVMSGHVTPEVKGSGDVSREIPSDQHKKLITVDRKQDGGHQTKLTDDKEHDPRVENPVVPTITCQSGKKRGRKPKSQSLRAGNWSGAGDQVEQPGDKAPKVDKPGGDNAENSSLLSPRRSGRGTMPNSRYKDMHLFSTAKKQHQTPSGKTGKEKRVDHEKALKSPKLPVNPEESKSITDSKKLPSDLKVKEKPKLKTFSSGASMARAQAKAQLQAGVKSQLQADMRAQQQSSAKTHQSEKHIDKPQGLTDKTQCAEDIPKQKINKSITDVADTEKRSHSAVRTSPATSPATIPATSPATIPATSPATIPATSNLRQTEHKHQIQTHVKKQVGTHGDKQAEPKGKTDKFSIREIAHGFEVTGRDGIPVVVAAENIVRVPLPEKSSQPVTGRTEKTSDSSHNESSEQHTQLAVNTKVDSRDQTISEVEDTKASSASQGTISDACVQSTAVKPSHIEVDNGCPEAMGINDSDSKANHIEVDNGCPEAMGITDSDSKANHIEVDNGCPEAMGITDSDSEAKALVEQAACEVQVSGVVEVSSNPGGSSEHKCRNTGSVSPVTGALGTTGTPDLAVVEEVVEVVESIREQAERGETGLGDKQRGVSDTHQGAGGQEVTLEKSDVPVMDVVSSSSAKAHLTMLGKVDEGGAVFVVDKTKKLPHQFLKETLSSSSSLPPTKPGYVISSPRSTSSVVKIVTLSSMLEETKTTIKKEPGLQEEGQPPCVSILQPPPAAPRSTISLADSRPTGVDMILEGSKTVESAAATVPGDRPKDQVAAPEACTEEIDRKPVVEADAKSCSTSTSTQTPIDRDSEKTIIPTMYKSRVESPMKTVTVNLGKRELSEGEVGFEDSEAGGKKSEEYILVELPEGATVQQRYVKSRTKIDDSMFLSTESMVRGVYHCTLCNYETNKKANWYKHKRKHMGFREYECPQCSYRAATSSNLKRHVAIHQDVRAFPCTQCGLSFRQKIHLERHIKYKHEEKQIKCPFCDYMCANENPDLKVHIKRKHLPTQSADGTINAFACPECKLVTISRKDLKQHMKFHRKGPELKLFCEHCSFVTDCESRLRRHELIHTKEKPFQCGLCDYRGSQKEHVLRHMRSVHNIDVARRKRKSVLGEGEGEEGQLETSQVMRDLGKLLDKSDYSTKDKIFACNHCTMKFSKLINLYKHLHTQHRSIMSSEEAEDYSCVVCDFRTNTKKNLLVHMRKHNMNDHSPPSHLYSCVLCRYTNPKRRNLFQHMRKKHRIEIVMKDDGSTSCFVTDTSNIQEDMEHNMLTVGDVVTATTADTDSQEDPTGVQGVISLEDLATLVAPEPNHDNNFVIDTGQLQATSLSSLVQQHEAAEAIEGLQALAGQINLADSVIEEVHVMDDPALDPITMETTVETSREGAEEKSSIELSAEQLINLSSGDYVEINGEMYKVEIAGDEGAKATPAALTEAPRVQPHS